jgi:hypothetical protein
MCLLSLFGMIEPPPGVATMVSSHGDKSIEQRPFLWGGGFTLLRCDLLQYFPPGLIPQRLFDVPLLWNYAAGNRFIEATAYSSLLAS